MQQTYAFLFNKNTFPVQKMLPVLRLTCFFSQRSINDRANCYSGLTFELISLITK